MLGGIKRETELEELCFHNGTNCRAFDLLGAHSEGGGVTFRVWAPNADFVSVCGDFNGWNPRCNPMRRVTVAGIWEFKLPADQIEPGSFYKFYIQRGEHSFYKADPYGFSMGCPPETASVYRGEIAHSWRDDGWLRHRRACYTGQETYRQPIHIYEMHLGSWMRRQNRGYLNYTELAREAAPYLKQMGYTHVELLPLSEHGEDASLGDRVSGFYAPTARHGRPWELMELVDAFHEAGLGVMLQWSPAALPSDEHGLISFDGAPLYEQSREGRWRGEDGSLRFDLTREEVRSFLLSSAVYWIECYHIDGLQIGGIASLIAADGGNNEVEREAAAELLRSLNGLLAKEYPDVITVADAAELDCRITGFENGGLGFRFRRDNAWGRRILEYFSTDPWWRKFHHESLTRSVSYADAEPFILPLTQGLLGQNGVYGRMFGDHTMKLAQMRLLLLYLITQPGKKAVFMGSECAFPSPWRFGESLPWHLLEGETRSCFQYYASAVNRFYLEEPALWSCCGSHGFQWIDAENSEESLLSYRCSDGEGGELIVVLNFTPVKREHVSLAVPGEGVYREVFNTDAAEFGGGGAVNAGDRMTEPCACGHVLQITAPPMGGIVLRLQ